MQFQSSLPKLQWVYIQHSFWLIPKWREKWEAEVLKAPRSHTHNDSFPLSQSLCSCCQGSNRKASTGLFCSCVCFLIRDPHKSPHDFCTIFFQFMEAAYFCKSFFYLSSYLQVIAIMTILQRFSEQYKKVIYLFSRKLLATSLLKQFWWSPVVFLYRHVLNPTQKLIDSKHLKLTVYMYRIMYIVESMYQENWRDWFKIHITQLEISFCMNYLSRTATMILWSNSWWH